MSAEIKVTGNILASPESRMVDVKGERRRITEFRIMDNAYRRNESGDYVPVEGKSVPYTVTVWHERLGEATLKLLITGARVQVEGNLSVDEWIDKEDGRDRYGLKIDASNVALNLTRVEKITWKPKSQANEQGQA